MNTLISYQDFSIQPSFLSANRKASFKAVIPTGDHKNMDTEPLRILIVEDEPISQRVAQLSLESMGYKVDIAGTGKEAIELFANNNYVAVLMDMGLPDMLGTEVTKQIRELEYAKRIHTPVIALTAHIAAVAKNECLSAGMDDFISKPLEIEPLKELLESWLVKSN